MRLLHPSYANSNVHWWFCGCTNARVALIQASQAGFMALWEAMPGIQYEISILSMQAGLNMIILVFIHFKAISSYD